MTCPRTGIAFLAALLAIAAGSTPAHAATLPPVVRGGRAIMLQAERGELTVRLYKKDLNIYDGADTLTGVLLGPQRQPLGEMTIAGG